MERMVRQFVIVSVDIWLPALAPKMPDQESEAGLGSTCGKAHLSQRGQQSNFEAKFVPF